MNETQQCSLCKEVMNVFSRHYPIELECSHNVCFTCCTERSPQELPSVACITCN